MKSSVIFLSLLVLGLAMPQPRKTFLENVDDFMDLIIVEALPEMAQLNNYMSFEEFIASLDYLGTTDFKGIVYEMEDLPEFKAVVEFLEGHNIDILYFINLLNNMIESLIPSRLLLLQETSGKDMSSFIKDSIALFPKEKLAALYEQKINEDEDFKIAMESLRSDEFQELWNALWENETFKAEADVLAENGIELELLVEEVLAIFGQN
ncbi:uncharacterized protein LOC126968609 [Leptidea sinapis]|uniref:uncharacterized protein LOC126968609 n=1 Tax=Leptidea sinapis TaxID=189913 RepID=UPI0021C4B325|nr:uncharacterized protein LOC126968609 [Leptidea sinapis]